MKITDEQIEKAAKAAFFARYPQDPHPAAWDEIGDKQKAHWRNAARSALEAVMPEESPSSASRWEAREIAREMLADLRNEGVSAAHIRDYADMVADALLRRFNHDHPAPEPGELERLREAHRENIRLLGLVAHDLTGRVEGGKVAAIYTAIRRSEAALAEGESHE